jgi:hypothetical protein
MNKVALLPLSSEVMVPFGMKIYLKIQIKDEAVLLFLPLFTSFHHTHLTLPHILGSLAPPPAAAATL